LRTMALPALIKVVAKMSHIVAFPIQVVSVSIQRESESKYLMASPL
jgi:hypothetical protein